MPPPIALRRCFAIDAGPRIRLRAIGAKVSEHSLGRFVPIFEEHSVDADLLTEGTHNLEDYFQSKGYFDAEVEFKQQRVINDQASIDYLINLGARHKLVFIGIQGNHYFSTEDIRERMFLRTASWLQFPHGRYSADLLRRDEDSIVSLYQSNGFRDVKVTDRLDDRYRGQERRAGRVDHHQRGRPDFRQQPGRGRHRAARQGEDSFPAQLGRQSAVQRVQYRGGPRRHPGAVLPERLSQRHISWNSKPAAPNRVDVSYTIREGGREFVRQVLFNPGGLAHTRPSLVYKNLKLNPGDPLSPTAMSETQRRLYDLGVFSRVDMAMQDPDGETDQKYVVYDLEEARRYSLSLGVGAEFARIGGCSIAWMRRPGRTDSRRVFPSA
jgi:outer membrane protein insertion porin family